MKRFELEEKERKVLETLAKRDDAASDLARGAAETWTLPGKTLSVLRDLSNAGFVLLRDDTNSPDGMLVAITGEARVYLNGSLV